MSTVTAKAKMHLIYSFSILRCQIDVFIASRLSLEFSLAQATLLYTTEREIDRYSPFLLRVIS